MSPGGRVTKSKSGGVNKRNAGSLKNKKTQNSASNGDKTIPLPPSPKRSSLKVNKMKQITVIRNKIALYVNWQSNPRIYFPLSMPRQMSQSTKMIQRKKNLVFVF